MDSGKVLLGVLAGVAVGALLGVLMAPQKGSDLRKKILDGGDELKDGLKEKLNEIVDAITEKFEKVKEDVHGFAQNDRTSNEQMK